MSVIAVRIATFICFITAFAVLSACGGKEEGSAKFPSLLPTPTPGTGPGTTVSEGAFGISAKFPTYWKKPSLHKNSSWSDLCEIPASETSWAGRNISCTMEVSELDLWFGNFDLEFQSPNGMCSYVLVVPFWFWTDEWRSVSGAVSYTYDKRNDRISSFAYTPGVGSTAGDVLVKADTSGKQFVGCKYDYTGQYTDAGNCCMGGVTATITMIETTGTTSPPVDAEIQFGGNAFNCAKGPALDVGKTLSGGPEYPLVSTEGGKKTYSYNVKSMLESKKYSETRYVANYLRSGLTRPLAFSTEPYAMGYYQWHCYDSAFEKLATIKLEVREWNLEAELAKGSSGSPDTGGTEPNSGESINDFDDWEDLVAPIVGSPRQYPKGDL